MPILLYNVLKACLLFKSAHKVKSSDSKVETYLMNQNHIRPQYNSQISIPKPDFQDLRTFGSAPPRYYNEFESANQNCNKAIKIHQTNNKLLTMMQLNENYSSSRTIIFDMIKYYWSSNKYYGTMF